jgi:hypothetical protein
LRVHHRGLMWSRVALSAVIVSALWCVATPARADAQNPAPRTQPLRSRPLVALEGAGLVSTVRGDALDKAGDGAGFDALLSVGNRGLSFGAGYQRSSHPLGTTNANVTVGGPFVEPRVVFNLADGNATPYLFARAAYLTRSSDVSGDGDAHGTAFGGGVGTLIWLAPNLQLNAGVMWQDLQFDRRGLVILPVPGVSSRVTGSQWSLRAGLVVGIGGWK